MPDTVTLRPVPLTFKEMLPTNFLSVKSFVVYPDLGFNFAVTDDFDKLWQQQFQSS